MGRSDAEKPGRPPGKSKKRDAVDAIAQTCLDEAGGHSGKAKRTFIKRVCALKCTSGRIARIISGMR